MKKKKLSIWTLALLLGCGANFFSCELSKAKRELNVNVRVTPFRPKAGEMVTIEAEIQSPKRLGQSNIQAHLLVPSRGVRTLPLAPVPPRREGKALFRGGLSIGADSPQGLYVVTLTVAHGSQVAAGKGSFLVGRVVGDFMILSAFSNQNVEADMRRYYEDFRRIGGNMVTIHNIMTEKALYPSAVCAKSASAGTAEDRVGLALKLAQEYGLASFISVSWDMTRPMPYSECLASTKEVMAELWKFYRAEPSLAGFYSYQEGSGTYLASQLREFCQAAKSLNPGVLTSCAPYIDDPLLAGYLAAIDDLDIIIYQGAVMASYRKDNRKCFPLRRTKDFTSLSAGATRPRNKITLSHVELFGYLEKRVAGAYLASRQDIYSQILSAAAAYGPEGIVFFTYHACIHELNKTVPEAKESRWGVEEGMKAYTMISRTAASDSSRIGVYIPYSDWWVDRWTNATVPSLDAFRRLGISPDIIPFLPPKGEEILPYYPYHLNEEQLDFLLRHRYVLVLSDIAGMQDTDSLLLKEFIEKGGVAILFGPSIPYGDRFDREALCGARENPAKLHRWVSVQEALGRRTKKGTRFGLRPGKASSWSPLSASARVVAAFEDGTGAALVNEFGQGLCITVSLGLEEMVESVPRFARDIMDFALDRSGNKRAFDVLGLAQELDVAESTVDGQPYLSIVNHKDDPCLVTILPLLLTPGSSFDLRDERTGRFFSRNQSGLLSGQRIRVEVPARDFILLSLSEK